jgi:TRAP-type mannitol/chloroaromatic compound transport system permease small subunit
MIFVTPDLPTQYKEILENIVQLREKLRFATSDSINRWTGFLARMAYARAIHSSNTMEGINVTLISAGNAIVRKVFNVSSNAYLEIQWYLFAAVFLLAAGYTMLRQGHVKIDVISGRFSKRTQIWIDIVGLAFFVLPLVYTVIQLSLPLVIRAYQMNEYSSNAGGLIRWPVFALLPLGFLLLGIQALSELIKRVAFLKGLAPDPTRAAQAKTPEEELAEFLAQKEVAAREAAALAAKS